MADDTVIRASTVVDVAGAKAGLAILQEQYRTTTADIRQSVNRVVDAEKQAAEAIAAGHASIAAALQAAARTERSELDQLITKQMELKAALDAATASHEHQVSQMAAASGAIRVFEGALPIRAVENFATKTLGLGPILQAAFPVIGAVALGEAIYSVFEKFTKVSEAEKKATEEAIKLEREIEQIAQSIYRLDLKAFEDQFGRTAAKAKEAADVTIGFSTLAVQQDILLIQKQIAEQKEKISEINAFNNNQEGVTGFNMDLEKKKLADLIEELNKFQIKQTEIAKVSADLSRAATQGSLDDQQKGRNEATEAANRAATDAARIRREALAEQERMEANWTRELDAQDRIREKIASDKLHFDEDIFSVDIRAIEEHDRTVVEATRKATEAQKRAYDEQRHILAADTESGQSSAQGAGSQQKLQLDRQRALAINSTPQDQIQYLEALKAIDAKILQEKYQFQLKLIQLDSLHDPAKVADDMKKLEQIVQQGQQKIYQDQTKILVAQMAAHRVFWADVSAGSAKVANDILTANHRWAADLGQIISHAIEQFAQMEIKRVISWLAGTAAIQTAETALMGILQSLHLVSAATAVTTGLTESQALIQAAAQLAGANAVASTAAIPFIGPELAPAAGAATFAVAESFAAFEKGTAYVPNTGVALVHQGERIIDASSNQKITSAIAGGAGGGFTHNGDLVVNAGAGANGKDLASQIHEAFKHLIRVKGLKMA